MVGGLKEVAEELKRAVQRNRQTCEELVVVAESVKRFETLSVQLL